VEKERSISGAARRMEIIIKKPKEKELLEEVGCYLH